MHPTVNNRELVVECKHVFVPSQTFLNARPTEPIVRFASFVLERNQLEAAPFFVTELGPFPQFPSTADKPNCADVPPRQFWQMTSRLFFSCHEITPKTLRAFHA